MALAEEIKEARKEIVADGYEMSLGEIINLYKDREIVIRPEFQRLFRWDQSRKTRFIESILLGIPVPPIFVFQRDDGVWELIDGLQRLSTILEFVGILKDDEQNVYPASELEGTTFLPSFAGARWAPNPDGSGNAIGDAQQLHLKRSRLRVEILLQESDPTAKYELFQRLNTGGAGLSHQEVRNCVAIMVNKDFFDWLRRQANNASFLAAIAQTDAALEKESATELALRFFAFRNVPYDNGMDVHEYLDAALLCMATNAEFDYAAEASTFEQTFELIHSSMGEKAFKRWDGIDFKGKFLMSVFEVVATGVSYNLPTIQANADPDTFIREKCQALWENAFFDANSGAGVRGTTRLANLLPMAQNFLGP